MHDFFREVVEVAAAEIACGNESPNAETPPTRKNSRRVPPSESHRDNTVTVFR